MSPEFHVFLNTKRVFYVEYIFCVELDTHSSYITQSSANGHEQELQQQPPFRIIIIIIINISNLRIVKLPCIIHGCKTIAMQLKLVFGGWVVIVITLLECVHKTKEGSTSNAKVVPAAIPFVSPRRR